MRFKIIKLLVFLCVLLIPVSTCSAIKLDSVGDDYEWSESQTLVLLNEKDSNNVDHGQVSYYVDKNGFDVYFLIYFSDKTDAGYDSAGILITLDKTMISVDSKGNIVNPDPNSYLISAAVNVEENDGYYCEMKIGFKKGLQQSVNAKISFVDGEGTHSYHYPFTVRNKYFATSAQSTTVLKTQPVRTTAYRPTVQKTTKTRITKPATTRAAKKTEKTTKRVSYKSEENGTVVYYLEKEVIISQVYDDSVGIANTEPVCSAYSQSGATSLLNKSNAMAAEYNIGKTIFRVVCVITGILLAILAIWVAFNPKKSDKKDEIKESDGNENKSS